MQVVVAVPQDDSLLSQNKLITTPQAMDQVDLVAVGLEALKPVLPEETQYQILVVVAAAEVILPMERQEELVLTLVQAATVVLV